MRTRNLLLLAVVALAGAVAFAARRGRRPDAPAAGPDPKTDAQLDDAIAETFPASDPIAIGRIE
jgi:hypothetical protein